MIYFSIKLRENSHFSSIFAVIYVDLGRPQVEHKLTCDATEKGATRESQLVPGCRFPGLTATQIHSNSDLQESSHDRRRG